MGRFHYPKIAFVDPDELDVRLGTLHLFMGPYKSVISFDTPENQNNSLACWVSTCMFSDQDLRNTDH